MRRIPLPLFAGALLLLSSCSFFGNRQWEDIAEVLQITDSTSADVETVEEEIPEEEAARELKWYEKDYSITVVDLDENVTYTYTRKEDVYYVDKEYGFIYEKKSSASGNVGVSFKDKSHFRVTAFTDKP